MSRFVNVLFAIGCDTAENRSDPAVTVEAAPTHILAIYTDSVEPRTRAQSLLLGFGEEANRLGYGVNMDWELANHEAGALCPGATFTSFSPPTSGLFNFVGPLPLSAPHIGELQLGLIQVGRAAPVEGRVCAAAGHSIPVRGRIVLALDDGAAEVFAQVPADKGQPKAVLAAPSAFASELSGAELVHLVEPASNGGDPLARPLLRLRSAAPQHVLVIAVGEPAVTATALERTLTACSSATEPSTVACSVATVSTLAELSALISAPNGQPPACVTCGDIGDVDWIYPLNLESLADDRASIATLEATLANVAAAPLISNRPEAVSQGYAFAVGVLEKRLGRWLALAFDSFQHNQGIVARPHTFTAREFELRVCSDRLPRGTRDVICRDGDCEDVSCPPPPSRQ